MTDQRNIDDLFAATYEELRRLASTVRRRNKNVTLNPTALVHEAWIKLAGSECIASTSKLHFKRIAARAMRQVLIDAARRKKARKRSGAEDTVLLTVDPSSPPAALIGEDLLALDSVLEKLAQMSPRQATMVESRFFGGLDIAEIAELLEVSEATVIRDWRAARAWLAQEFRRI